MANFSLRVRKAREHAGLSQSALASRLGVKQQAVQYLENPKKAAQASRYTSAIARHCGVSAEWLESGTGAMLGAPAANTVAEPTAKYHAPSAEAKQIAEAWMLLSPDAQAWMRDLIYILSITERKYPWLRRGRPKSESYDQFEKRMVQNFGALKGLHPNNTK